MTTRSSTVEQVATTDGSNHPSSSPRRDAAIIIALIVLTASMSIVRDLFRILDHDEFLSFHTDSQKTALDVVRVQLSTPISLDPLGYHLLAHSAMSVLGRNALAERLPSILGFITMVPCLYLFLRRIVPRQVAVVGALFPLATPAFGLSLTGRPYGLLLGLAALALLCWQSLARSMEKRPINLGMLAIALAMAVNAHYFGILVLLPLTAAELARIAQRRRIDRGVLCAIAFGYLSVAAILPFRKAILVYQTHYWTTNPVLLRSIPHYYVVLLLDRGGIQTHRIATLALIVLLPLAVWTIAVRLVRTRVMLPGELVALIVLALIPATGTALGVFVTHTFQPRYVVEGVLGVGLLMVLAAQTWLRPPPWAYVAQAVLLTYIVVFSVYQGHENYTGKKMEEAALVPSPVVAARLASDPDAPIYVQNSDIFYRSSYYLRNDDIRRRLRLLYGFDQEVRLNHMDTFSITAGFISRISSLRVAPFASFCNGQPHLLLTAGSSWEWIRQELKADPSTQTPIGRYMDADLEEVVCRPPDTMR